MLVNSDSLVERLEISIKIAKENYIWWAQESNPTCESGTDGGDWSVLQEVSDEQYPDIPEEYQERATLLLSAKRDAMRWSEEQAYKTHDATFEESWNPEQSLEENLEQVGPSYRDEIREDAQFTYRSQEGVHQLLLLKIQLEELIIEYLKTGNHKPL